MRLLLFSDLHRSVESARSIVELAHGVDVLVGAGDFATARVGIADVIDVLRAVDKPCVLVPGNAESDQELVEACEGWDAAHVLHGSGVRVEGVDFFGLGAAVPVTPFGAWSFDLPEAEAEQMLSACPSGAIVVSHSPPLGYADSSWGRHLGSRAVRDAMQRVGGPLLVCGHIHSSWQTRVQVGPTLVVNAGPAGVIVELD